MKLAAAGADLLQLGADGNSQPTQVGTGDLQFRSTNTEAGRAVPGGRAVGFKAGAAGLLLLLLTACRTPPPPPVDLTQPTWTVRQGQAVWTVPEPGREAEGVAGELLVATHEDGSCWIQFSKPPFNLVTARRTPSWWYVEFQQGHSRHRGRGNPPERLVWFQLERALRDETLVDWQFTRRADQSWTLVNPKTSERLEGYLTP